MEEGRSAFKILTGKPLGRPMHRWKGNIRIDLKEIVINTRNWADSAQNIVYWIYLVTAAMNLRLVSY